MTSDAQKKAVLKYNKANTVGFYIRFNRKTDSDILRWLELVGNKQGYIKRLIRMDIEANKEASKIRTISENQG